MGVRETLPHGRNVSSGFYAPPHRPHPMTAPTTPAEMAAALRALGYIVMDPPDDAIPEPRVGEVWRSANPRVHDRAVVTAGHTQWGWLVEYRIGHATRVSTADLSNWRAWARKTGARPVTP